MSLMKSLSGTKLISSQKRMSFDATKKQPERDFSKVSQALAIPEKLLENIWKNMEPSFEYKTDEIYFNDLITGKVKWILNPEHSMAFLNTQTMKGESPAIEEIQKKENLDSIILPQQFYPQNLNRINKYFQSKSNIIKLPNNTCFDMDFIINALSIFYKSGLTDIHLLYHKEFGKPLIIKSGTYEIYIASMGWDEKQIQEVETKENMYNLDNIIELGTVLPEEAEVSLQVRFFAKEMNMSNVFLNNILKSFYGEITEADQITKIIEENLEPLGSFIDQTNTMLLNPEKYQEHSLAKAMLNAYSNLIPIPKGIDLSKFKIANLSNRRLESLHPGKTKFLVEMPDGTYYHINKLRTILKIIEDSFPPGIFQFYNSKNKDFPLIIKKDNNRFLLAPVIEEEKEEGKESLEVIPIQAFLKLGMPKIKEGLRKTMEKRKKREGYYEITVT